MSKYMQLQVRIHPYYKTDFGKIYPRIAAGLKHLGEEWMDKDLSLFQLTGKIDRLLYQLEADPPARQILLKYKSKLHTLYEEIEEHIADWHLKEADRLLYQMEDVFDEIERELGNI